MKAIVEIGNTISIVTGDFPWDRVQHACSYEETRYYRQKGAAHPTARKSLVHLARRRGAGLVFPTGLVRRVISELQDTDYELYDKRRVPKGTPDFFWDGKGIPELRPYQVEGSTEALSCTRGVLNHPTGSGKTILVASIIQQISVSPNLYMVPNLTLLSQTVKKFEKYFGSDEIGSVGGGEFEIYKPIVIATAQTLWSRRETREVKNLLKTCGVLIVDESHHVSTGGGGKGKEKGLGNTWYRIAQKCEAYWRFGVTATPGEEETPQRMRLEAVTGREIHYVSTSRLIGEGYLSPVKIKLIRTVIPEKRTNWDEAYSMWILDNSDRNQRIREEALYYMDSGRSVLIIVDRLDHGRFLVESLVQTSSHDVRFITGEVSKEDREEVRNLFQEKKIQGLVSTVFSEGVDVPSLDVVILASGGKSQKKVIQRLGRVLRPSSDKKTAIVIDFLDDDSGGTGKMGMLGRHSKERIKVYESEEAFEIERVGWEG